MALPASFRHVMQMALPASFRQKINQMRGITHAK